MNDIQLLLDTLFPFVDDLLIKQGEFYPFATAIKEDEALKQIILHDGDEFPLSETVIKNLKSALKAERKEYKAISIFYDVKVTPHDSDSKTDAVAIHVESKYDEEAFIFYYPYLLSDEGKLTYQASWKTKIAAEIFTD